jgi:ABC-2 type transport system ATP-binding protein
VLTTHYIEEAEDMADRVGVINHGRIILVEDKVTLMRKLGKKQLTLQLQTPLAQIPPALSAHQLVLNGNGYELTYAYDPRASQGAVAALLDDLSRADIKLKDLQTTQSSLEDIFVSLVRGRQ